MTEKLKHLGSFFELALPQWQNPEITLQIQYKDNSGNPFTKINPVNLDISLLNHQIRDPLVAVGLVDQETR